MALLYCCEKVAYSIRLAQRSVLTVTLDVAQFYVYIDKEGCFFY